jgi:hypothetical protein
MKRFFAGTCLAAVCAVGVSAQTAGQTPAQSPAAKDDKAVTVTGCLRAGEQPNTFVLANAKWDGKDSPSSATGTSGAAGAAAAGASAADKTIKLIGSPAGTQLSEHVGHTVQVTGKLAGMSSMTGTTGSGTGTGTAGSATAGSRPAQPSLNVESVKMVSTSCDGK